MKYDFSEAMGLVRSGERVRRSSWAASWLFLAEGGPADGPDKVYLIEKQPGEAERATEFVARDADLMAADWVVVGAAPAPDPSADVPPGPTNDDFLRGVPSGMKTATAAAHAAAYGEAHAAAHAADVPPAEPETEAEKPE